MISIERPVVVRHPTHRSVGVGNEAIVEVGGALITLLESIVGGARIGAGYQAPLTIPFGLCVTAALGALGETDAVQGRWTVRRATVAWSDRASGRGALTARATVTRVQAHDVYVDVQASEADKPLLSANLRLLAMKDGRYAAMARPLGPVLNAPGTDALQPRQDDSLLALRPPRLVEGSEPIEMEFWPDLVELLMHPVAGNSEPLGRRVHPVGGALLGAAISAAIASRGERNVDHPARMVVERADVTWLAPVPSQRSWVAKVRREHTDDTTAAVDVGVRDGRTALTALIALGRSQR